MGTMATQVLIRFIHPVTGGISEINFGTAPCFGTPIIVIAGKYCKILDIIEVEEPKDLLKVEDDVKIQ